MSNSQNHYFGRLDECRGSLPGLQLHLASRPRGDNRSNLLAAYRNFHFRHQAAYANRIDSSHQLVPPAHPADYKLALLLRLASRPEQQPIDFALGNTVMSSGGLNTADFLPVDPLFDRGKADSQLQSSVPEL
jgi:hypothetical protein